MLNKGTSRSPGTLLPMACTQKQPLFAAVMSISEVFYQNMVLKDVCPALDG